MSLLYNIKILIYINVMGNTKALSPKGFGNTMKFLSKYM